MIGQIERGTAFYQQLVNHLKNLEEHVDGYVFARKEEFKELLNVLDHVEVKVNPPSDVQEKGQEKKKDNNNEIWFNEELNQFPLGSSVFMPNKGKGGGLLESTVVVNLSDKK